MAKIDPPGDWFQLTTLAEFGAARAKAEVSRRFDRHRSLAVASVLLKIGVVFLCIAVVIPSGDVGSILRGLINILSDVRSWEDRFILSLLLSAWDRPASIRVLLAVLGSTCLILGISRVMLVVRELLLHLDNEATRS